MRCGSVRPAGRFSDREIGGLAKSSPIGYIYRQTQSDVHTWPKIKKRELEKIMAETPSTMLDLGTPMPEFTLTDAVSGNEMNQAALLGDKATLVMFICNHCPFVKHVVDELTRLGADYLPKGLGIVAINSNDIESYPQDDPKQMKRLAAAKGWKFPFLLDDTQKVAKAFKAACTPDFFLFGTDSTLVYRGQLDDSRPGGAPPTGADLRAAIDAVLAGGSAPAPQKPSIGCNIKWKPGNEPPYFG
jgi:thiol-disulfide isomerase/thioredoxin